MIYLCFYFGARQESGQAEADVDLEADNNKYQELAEKFKVALAEFKSAEGLADAGEDPEDKTKEKQTEPFVKAVQNIMKDTAKDTGHSTDQASNGLLLGRQPVSINCTRRFRWATRMP